MEREQMKMQPDLKNQPKAEKELKPRILFRISRHANRTPSGELTPEGIEEAQSKGKTIGQSSEVFKSYASDEKTKRTVKTAEEMSKASGVISPLRDLEASEDKDKRYATREVADIQYAILLPDFKKEMGEASRRIDEATLKEVGLFGQLDEKGEPITLIKQLPEEEQKKLAKIREKNQDLGMNYILTIPEAAHRMAIGLSNQIVKEIKIGGRYLSEYRKKNELKKDMTMNSQTHGLFQESLLLNAAVIKRENGDLEEIKDIESSEIGGFLKPNESLSLDLDMNVLKNLPLRPTTEDLKKALPKEIPIIFEGTNRPKAGTVFIDRDKLLSLAEEYQELQKSRKET
jgi:hypothetical protein